MWSWHSFAFKRHRAPSLTSCSFFFLSCSFKTHFKEILQIWIKVICNAVGFLSEGTKYDKAMRKATMAAFCLKFCVQTPSRLRFPLLEKTTLKMLTSWFILGSLNPWVSSAPFWFRHTCSNLYTHFPHAWVWKLLKLPVYGAFLSHVFLEI